MFLFRIVPKTPPPTDKAAPGDPEYLLSKIEIRHDGMASQRIHTFDQPCWDCYIQGNYFRNQTKRLTEEKRE